jgi:hypothetical protein
LGYNAVIIGLKIRNNTQAPVTERPVALPPEGMGGASMLQELSKEIQECYRHAAECRQRAERTFTEKGRQGFLDMERRWLSLAHSYEFAEGLANYVEPFRKPNRKRPSE